MIPARPLDSPKSPCSSVGHSGVAHFSRRRALPLPCLIHAVAAGLAPPVRFAGCGGGGAGTTPSSSDDVIQKLCRDFSSQPLLHAQSPETAASALVAMFLAKIPCAGAKS